MSNLTIAADYVLIETAAIKGERCPKQRPFGPLSYGSTIALARSGRIRIELYAHNWRVITLLDGPHRGCSTAPAPNGWRRYKMIDVRGITDASRIGGRPA
jgi:hypothetical protein